MNKELKKLMIIDGSCLVAAAYYATVPKGSYQLDGNSPEYCALIPKTRDGKYYQNAYVSSVRRLESYIHDFQPTHLVAVWDPKGGSFRNKLNPEYKGTRKSKPAPLAEQLNTVVQYMSMANVCQFKLKGMEADDLAGTLSTILKDHFDEIYLITNDRDYLQLVNEKVKVVLQLNRKTMQEYLEKGTRQDIDNKCQHLGNPFQYIVNDINIRAIYGGLSAEQVVSFKAIAGDSGDNIKGIGGIGEESAKALLKTHGTMRNLYIAVMDAKGNEEKQAELIKMWKDNGLQKNCMKTLINDFETKKSGQLSYKLATIVKDIPIKEILLDGAIEKAPKGDLTSMSEEECIEELVRAMNCKDHQFGTANHYSRGMGFQFKGEENLYH